MAAVVVTPPAPILTPAEARRLSPSLAGDDDTTLTLLISIAQAEIEPPHTWIGAAFGRQTLELRTSAPCGPVPLPYPPFHQLVEVSYLDADGAPQPIDVADVFVAEGRLYAVDGFAWPSMSCRPDALRVQYVAGYEDDDPALLPAKQAVALGIQELRAIGAPTMGLVRDRVDGIGEKQWSEGDKALAPVRTAMERLLRRYQVLRL